MGFNFDQSKRGQYRKKKTVGPYQQGAPNPPAPSTMHNAPKAPAPPAPSTMYNAPKAPAPPAPSTMHNAPASTADAVEERMGPYTQGVSSATGGTTAVGPYTQGAPTPTVDTTAVGPYTQGESIATGGTTAVGPYTQGVSTATGGTTLAVDANADAAAEAAAIAAAAEDDRKRKEAQKKQEEDAAAAAAAAAEDARRQQEAANLSEVMEAIRNNPMAFHGGANLLNYRTSGGLSLNELSQSTQDQMNTYLGGGEYAQLLATAQDKDPGTQLQRMRDEQRARDQAAEADAAARAKRESDAAAALAAQQAAPTIQASTAAIEQAAPAVTGAANVVAGVGGPAANQNTGLNEAINEQLAETAALDLQSNDELRRNQQALLAELSNQAEAAGKSAVTDLTLPDLTKTNVPAREMSTMEQAIDTRLTDRLTGGQFLDPQSALTNEAEAQALERLQQDSYLGGSAGLDSAERRALDRMTNDNLLGENTGLDAAEAAALARMQEGGSGVDLEGSLATSAEDIIRQRLLGGENPMMAAQRARVEERYGTSMDEGREMLNRLGVLRGGDTADVFNELTRGRDQQMLDVDAMGFDLQSQAIADALGYQGRRDALGLANEELARGAISDVAGLAGQRDQRNVAEQALQRGAISDVAGLAGQRDDRAIAEQGLRREAIADTLPFQQRRDAIGLAEQDLQRAAISDALGRQGMIDERDFAEAELTGAIRGEATLPARMAQAGLQFDAANLQQDVADRTLARLLTQTEPTQRERFEEGVRQSRFGEGLATRADLRAEEGLQSDLYGEVAGRGSAPARTTLAGQSAEQDMLNQALQRRLAQRSDIRAEEALQGDLFGEVAGRGSAPARKTRGAQMDAFNQELARAGLTGQFEGGDTLAERALDSDLETATSQRAAMADDLTTASLNRQLARSADTRAGQALEADLFGEVSGVGSDPTMRTTLGGQRTESDLLTAEGQREAMADDLTTASLNRQLARSADTRAGQAQDAALFGEVAGEGSDPTMRTTLSGQGFEEDLTTSRLNRTLAQSADTRAEEAQDKTFDNQRIDQILAAAEAGLIDQQTANQYVLQALGLNRTPIIDDNTTTDTTTTDTTTTDGNTYTGTGLGATGRLPQINMMPGGAGGRKPTQEEFLAGNSDWGLDEGGNVRFMPGGELPQTSENTGIWGRQEVDMGGRRGIQSRRYNKLDSSEYERQLMENKTDFTLDPELANTIEEQMNELTNGGTTLPRAPINRPTEDQITTAVDQLGDKGFKMEISDNLIKNVIAGQVERGEITQSEADAIFANWKERNP